MLPTIVLGALPGEPEWAGRLARIGIDVAASGADEDTPETVVAARSAAPHLALKARAVNAGAFDGMRGLIVETPGEAPPGTYLLGEGDSAIEAVDGSSEEVEDVMDIARRTLDAAREGVASELWVVATPGLELLHEDVVEAKLTALAEGARQARLYLAKEQFD